MPSSYLNPGILLPTDIPKNAGGLPQTGPPLTGLTGLKLNYPLEKAYMTGAVRRDLDGIQFNSGASLAASTAYPGWMVLIRAALVTGLYLIIGTAPTGANCTLAVTYNGVSLLSTATYTVNSTTPVSQLIKLPFTTTAAFLDQPPNTCPTGTPTNEYSGLPYLTSANGVNGYPYPILCTYTEGATTVHTGNVALVMEFEPDDFNG
jgi:hypothetical protein